MSNYILSKQENQLTNEIQNSLNFNYYFDSNDFQLREKDIIDKNGKLRGTVNFYFKITQDQYNIGYYFDTDYLKDKDEWSYDKSKTSLEYFRNDILQSYLYFLSVKLAKITMH